MGEGKRGKPRNELERLEIFEQLAMNTSEWSSCSSRRAGRCRRAPSRGSAGSGWSFSARPCCAGLIVRDEHVSLKLVVRALRVCNPAADGGLAAGADAVTALFTAEMVRGRQHDIPGAHPG